MNATGGVRPLVDPVFLTASARRDDPKRRFILFTANSIHRWTVSDTFFHACSVTPGSSPGR